MRLGRQVLGPRSWRAARAGPGALVFYGGGGGLGHVAISVGGGQVIGTLGYAGDREPVSRTSYTRFPYYYGWTLP